MELLDCSCKGFVEKLGAKEPVPGGGGAASLVGAMGSALGSMALRFTFGKEKFKKYELQISDLIGDFEKISKGLLALVEADEEAFYPLSQAYGIPKDEPERDERIQKALKIAVCPPLEMTRLIGDAIELLLRAKDMTSVLLISDICCAAVLSKAALEAAAVNVYVNTNLMTDREYAKRIEDEVDEMMDAFIKMADLIILETKAKIRKNT